MDATITRLRDELTRLEGPARIPVLVQLGQELGMAYWRAGPGTPGGLGELSDAIAAYREAHRLLGNTDPAREQVAARLGWLLWARYGAHGGAAEDRETALAMLGEAQRGTGLPPVHLTTTRIALGQLHLMRAVEAMNPQAARAGFLGGGSPQARADAGEAIRHLRDVLAGPPVNAQVTEMTRTMLTLAEAIQPLLGGNLAGFDLGKIMDAMGVLQRMQQGGGTGMPSPLSFPLDLSTVDPIDYPVLDVRGPATPAPAAPPRRRPAAPVASTPPGSARQAARDRLAALSALPGRDPWEQVSALLTAGPRHTGTADLDAFVGAAVIAIEPDGGDPVETGLDHLLAAAGLCLRERRDGSGWADEETIGADLVAAGHLREAARLIPSGHPAAASVVEVLGAALDDRRPLAAGTTGELAAYAAAVTSRPAPVDALAELCRAAAALNAGTEVDPEPLAAAVAAVPADHFAHRALSAAAGQARLVAAVRAGDPAAVRAGVVAYPGKLSDLLDALVHGDPDALRQALDALAGELRSPWVAAVAGAGHLALDGHGTGTDAIGPLSFAAHELDDTSGGLRARTWWRLAVAYRRRGAGGDAELSRAAATKALAAGGTDRDGAARFAGWMLAGGHGAEAFLALETAAAAGHTPPVPAAEDVVGVILGIVAPAPPPPGAPTPAAVAAAVRKTGATALLYAHPTDDTGRTAGVLCLDAATERLDVLANVPVTDPLVSDDPGWASVVGRWSTGTLLVAATGDLRRIAVPAIRDGAGRRLARDVGVSYVSSGARVIDLAGRSAVPVTRAPLFVVNPRGDRDSGMADVLVLRRLFHPTSACLGRALEPADGPGTRDELLGRLPGASLVHLACGLGHDGRPVIHLADGDLLLSGDDAYGHGLVIVAEPAPGGLTPVAEGLLDAGFSGVIGWQWPVPAPFAALAVFMTHLMLADRGLPPAAAVNAVHRWMLDPERDLPPFLPGAHANTVATTDPTRPALWAALSHHGC